MQEGADPIGIGRADCGGGAGVGWQAKKQDRRRAPTRPVARMASRMDEPPKPTHGAHRPDLGLITRTRDHRNRDGARDAAPVAPPVELRQIVRAHQPYEPAAGVAADEPAQRVGGKARAELAFYGGDADRGAARPRSRGSKARGEGRHVGSAVLQRVAGGDEPPHLVEAECMGGVQADRAVAAVRGIERAAEKAGGGQNLPAQSSRWWRTPLTAKRPCLTMKKSRSGVPLIRDLRWPRGVIEAIRGWSSKAKGAASILSRMRADSSGSIRR